MSLDRDSVVFEEGTRTISKSESIEKISVARLSIYSNASLTLLKLFAGLLSGSVSILSEAIHSAMDLIAATIAYVSVRISGEPPDMRHAYGHGKYEDIAGLIEALLIIIAAFIIISEAIQKLFHPHEFESSFLLLGIVVMGISAVTNIFVSRRLMKIAKKTDSIALEGDAWHLRTDVYTSAGVMVGLIVVYITGITFLDPLIAIGVALFILKAGLSLTKKSYSDLIDCSLSEEEQKEIEEIALQYKGEFVNMHCLRTRRAGPEVFIEFHIAVEANTSVHDAHALLDTIEVALLRAYPRATVTIHLEACERDCVTCTAKCENRHFIFANDLQK